MLVLYHNKFQYMLQHIAALVATTVEMESTCVLPLHSGGVGYPHVTCLGLQRMFVQHLATYIGTQ